MSGFLELFSQYDVLGAFLVNIEPVSYTHLTLPTTVPV